MLGRTVSCWIIWWNQNLWVATSIKTQRKQWCNQAEWAPSTLLVVVVGCICMQTQRCMAYLHNIIQVTCIFSQLFLLWYTWPWTIGTQYVLCTHNIIYRCLSKERVLCSELSKMGRLFASGHFAGKPVTAQRAGVIYTYLSYPIPSSSFHHSYRFTRLFSTSFGLVWSVQDWLVYFFSYLFLHSLTFP